MGVIGLLCIATRWISQVRKLRRPPGIGLLSNEEIDRL